jgi:F-type H+-transporting ATPase subunit gamma
MPTLLDFRRRIRSVKNTQQITRAMKFVAAARLRRAQESALAARPYATELARMLRSIMARIDEPRHPLLAKRPEERILAIVLSGERGARWAPSTRTSCAKPTSSCASTKIKTCPLFRSEKKAATR